MICAIEWQSFFSCFVKCVAIIDIYDLYKCTYAWQSFFLVICAFKKIISCLGLYNFMTILWFVPIHGNNLILCFCTNARHQFSQPIRRNDFFLWVVTIDGNHFFLWFVHMFGNHFVLWHVQNLFLLMVCTSLWQSFHRFVCLLDGNVAWCRGADECCVHQLCG